MTKKLRLVTLATETNSGLSSSKFVTGPIVRIFKTFWIVNKGKSKGKLQIRPVHWGASAREDTCPRPSAL